MKRIHISMDINGHKFGKYVDLSDTSRTKQDNYHVIQALVRSVEGTITRELGITTEYYQSRYPERFPKGKEVTNHDQGSEK